MREQQDPCPEGGSFQSNVATSSSLESCGDSDRTCRKFMLSLGTVDVERGLGGDLGTAFTYLEKGHRKRLPFLGTEFRLVGGNQGTLFSG